MIDHIAIAVNNLSESTNLYCDILGFELLEQRSTSGEYSGMNSAVLKKDNSVIVLLESHKETSQISKFIDNFGTGVQHLALKVDNIEKIIDRFLLKSAATDIEIIEGVGIRQVFLKRDIGSGVRIELIERNGGSFSDETIEKLFKAFERKDLY
jgi:methylmalonyl-CoA/ethylmalonyl-CoA epimerase